MTPFTRIFSIVSLALVALSVNAELPPGSYEMLKDSAEEKLDLEVLSVNSMGRHHCNEDFLVHARVKHVHRSASNIEEGTVLAFKSYTIHSDSRACYGWVGPQAPEDVEPGQCIQAHLNLDSNEPDTYRLAAYGQSYETINCYENPTECSPGELLLEVGRASNGCAVPPPSLFCCQVGGSIDDSTFSFDDCNEIAF